jgi:hypothetical protein
MLVLCFYCLFDSFGELLDIFNFFSVLVFYFLDDFERSMFLAEYLENFLFVAQMILLFNLHAVVTSLGAFYVEVDGALGPTAFDASTNMAAFLSTNDTPKRKSLEIKFIHSNRSSGSNIRSWHPH